MSDVMDDLPAPSEPLTSGAYPMNPAATVPRVSSSYIGRARNLPDPEEMSRLASVQVQSPHLPRADPMREQAPLVAPKLPPSWADFDRDVLDVAFDDAMAPPQEPDAPKPPAVQPPASMAPGPKGETFDQWVERAYDITPVVRWGLDTGRRLTKPDMGTEIARREAWKAAKRGDMSKLEKLEPFTRPVEQDGEKLVQTTAPDGWAGKSWQALVNGAESAQNQLNGMVGYGAGLANKAFGGSGTQNIVRRTGAYARWVAQDLSMNEVKGDNWFSRAYYDALGSLPAFALQVGAAAAGAGPAGFLVAGVGTSVGDQFNQSYQEYLDAGYNEDQATTNALVDGTIAGAITAVTNIPVAEFFFGKAAEGAVKQAVGMAKLRAVGRKMLMGAAAEGAQEFTEQAGIDFLTTLRKRDEEAFKEYFRQNPNWVADIMAGAARAGAAGALLGGAAGPLHGTHQPTGQKLTLSSEDMIRSAGNGLRSAAQVLQMTPEQVSVAMDRIADRQADVDEATRADVGHQRTVGKALDFGPFSNDALVRIVMEGNKGETADMVGSGRKFAVTVPMAADELARRRAYQDAVKSGPGLAVRPDGTASDEAIATWMQRNPQQARMVRSLGTLSRSGLERIAGGPVDGSSTTTRAALLERIKNAPEPADPRAQAAAEVESSMAGLNDEERAMAERGVAPESARKIASAAMEPGIPQQEPALAQEAGLPAPEAPQEPDEDAAAASRIGRLNGLGEGDVLVGDARTDAERRVASFADSKGLKVRFFRAREPVATNGAIIDGTIYLDRDLSTERAMLSVAVHESLDSLNQSDPESWKALEQALGEVAPEALQRVRALYQQRIDEQGSQRLSQSDLEREGPSNLAEAMVDAFSLHLAIDGEGHFDSAKARRLVGASPRAFARLAMAIRNMLAKLGLVRAATGMNDAQARRLEEYMDGDVKELARPHVRAFIANRLAGALNAMRSAERLADAGGLAQSIAYHGTPHKGIERFDSSRIGTGEGNQAFGHGLYFASKKEVADWYRTNLSQRILWKDGPPRSARDAGGLVEKELVALGLGSLRSKAVAKRFEHYFSIGLGIRDALLESVPASASEEEKETIMSIADKMAIHRNVDRPKFTVLARGGPQAAKRMDIERTRAWFDIEGRIGWLSTEKFTPEQALAKIKEDLESTIQADAERRDRPADPRHDAFMESVRTGLKMIEDGELVPHKDEPAGALYTVDLKPSDDEYMLWDKSISEQPRIAREALKQVLGTTYKVIGADGKQMMDYDGYGDDAPVEFWTLDEAREYMREFPGSSIKEVPTPDEEFDTLPASAAYHHLADMLGGPKEASSYLLSKGVRGNKYLDRTSRGVGAGTHNYVIFDDSDVEIKDVQSVKRKPGSEAEDEPVGDDERVVRVVNKVLDLLDRGSSKYATVSDVVDRIERLIDRYPTGSALVASLGDAVESFRADMDEDASVWGKRGDSDDVDDRFVRSVQDAVKAWQLGGSQSVGRKKRDARTQKEVEREFKEASSKEPRRRQARIDLAYQMGRRSGRVAGEIVGQKKGVKAVESERKKGQSAAASEARKGRKAVEAEQKKGQKRIDLAHRIGLHEGERMGRVKAAAQRDRLRSMIFGLRQQIHLMPKDGEVRAEMRALFRKLKKMANTNIRRLPKEWRANYAMSSTMTMQQVIDIGERVHQDLAMVPMIYLRRRLARSMVRLRRAKTIRNETRREARRLHQEAYQLLSREGGGRPTYTSDADIASRTSLAHQLMLQAESMMSRDREDAAQYKAERAKAVLDDAAELVDALAAKPRIATPDMADKPAEVGLARRVVAQWSHDTHTLERDMGEGWSRPMSGLRAGEEAENQHAIRIREGIDGILRKHGFKGREDYGARAEGRYGSAVAEKVKLPFLDEPVTMDTALSLAAQDPETIPDIERHGFVMASRKRGRIVKPTAQQLMALKRRHAGLVQDIKKFVESEIKKALFDEHFRLNVKQPREVEDYYRRFRLGDAIADAAEEIAGGAVDAALGMSRSAPMLEERTGGKAPFVIHGFMQTIEGTVRQALKFIHMAGPTRHAMSVLLDEGVRTQIAASMGDRMNTDLRDLVLHGSGIKPDAKPNDWVVKIGSAKAGAKIALSIFGALPRMFGGTFRTATEMPLASWAAGAARMAAMSPAERIRLSRWMEKNSGYFGHRRAASFVSVVANVTGEPSERDRAVIANALRASLASYKQAIGAARSARIRALAEGVRDGTVNLVRAMRAFESLLHTVDRQIGIAAQLGHEHQIRQEHPSMPDDQVRSLALQRSAMTFRRTQNASSALDDTVLGTGQKVRGAIGRLFFPFSSDPLKARNQLWRAIRHGDASEMGRAAFAIGANAAWSAGVGETLAMGLSWLIGGDDDDDRIMREKLMRDEAFRAGFKFGGEMSSSMLGYAGIALAEMAQQTYMKKGGDVDVGSNIMAVDALNDAINGAFNIVQDGDATSAAYGASEMLGIPFAQPIKGGASLLDKARPSAEDKAKELRRIRDNERRLTPEEARTLARLEREVNAAYVEAKKSGSMTRTQRKRLEAEERRRRVRGG